MTNQSASNLGFFEDEPERPAAESDDPMVGKVLAGRYRIERQLGRGGMGIVYLADEPDAGRQVAIKVLTGAASRSEELRNRFRREAETASKLKHPGLCGVHFFGSFDGLPFIAMDYLRGRSLADVLVDSRRACGIQEAKDPAGPTAEPQASTREAADPILETVLLSTRRGVSIDAMVRIIELSARALHVAHEMGLVHRDIKPANIMISPEGDPVLLDFGLARDLEAVGQTLTESGQIVGTPAYLAPEQITGHRKDVSPLTDIYALGVTLYECLTLRRPFQGESWDQLFHLILNGDWSDPRTFVAQLPKDLVTIVGKAMELEPQRRYPTAQAFAEDLLRVRSLEPIKARPPGPVRRVRRWAKRRPAAAAAAGAGALLFLGGSGFLVQRAVAEHFDLQAKLSLAAERLESKDLDAAAEAVAQASQIDPESARVGELRVLIDRSREIQARERARAEAMAAAEAARAESSARQAEALRRREALANSEAELAAERLAVYESYADASSRGRFAAREEDLNREAVEVERLLQEAEQSLQRAARFEAAHGEASAATRNAFADFYMLRWRDALRRNDPASAAWLAAAVSANDPERRYADELLGRGEIQLRAEPSDAELFLFRYESYDLIRNDQPVPRLVPVPTSGVGRSRPAAWVDGFFPGDPCLEITAVAPDSVSAQAGIRPGDLLIAVEGHPAGGGVFVRAVSGETPLGRPRPGDRIASINGVELESPLEWVQLPKLQDGTLDSLRVFGLSDEVALDRRQISPTTPQRLAEREAEWDLTLTLLRDGEPLELVVRKGQTSGLRTEYTSYPLILNSAHRVTSLAPISVDPGHYLIVARHPAREMQRYSLTVPRGGRLERAIELLLPGSTPEGAVYIPGGPFITGGDPRALLAGPRREVDLPGFFIRRYEVTTEEWFEFVNDPGTLQAIEAAGDGRYLPRDSTGIIASKRPDGSGWDRGAGYPQTPIFGVSWNDVQAWLAWRNRRAEAAGETWIYDLPTRLEWEKAARGADGRAFPWGDRFDHALTVGFYRKRTHLLDAPGGFEPADESPYGVRDLAGSREEWTQDLYESAENSDLKSYFVKGGAWGTGLSDAFRAAAEGYRNADAVGGNTGFRLVLRRRP